MADNIDTGNPETPIAQIHTSGGTVVQGNVESGGDFIGQDQIQGSKSVSSSNVVIHQHFHPVNLSNQPKLDSVEASLQINNAKDSQDASSLQSLEDILRRVKKYALKMTPPENHKAITKSNLADVLNQSPIRITKEQKAFLETLSLEKIIAMIVYNAWLLNQIEDDMTIEEDISVAEIANALDRLGQPLVI